MSKKNFVTLIMSVIGGILFALGMCMALVQQWDARIPGVVIAAVGTAILLAMVLVRRKMENKPAIVLNAKTIGAVALGVVGILILGIGMCMALIWDMLIPGIIIGIIGIVLLLCLIPMVKGLK